MKNKPVVAFDAKDFDRPKFLLVPDPDNPGKMKRQNTGFYSPLGLGVLYKDSENFVKTYVDETRSLSDSFNLPLGLPIYCSTVVKNQLGLRKAIPFCDQLVKKITKFIDLIHVSYVILPPKEIESVSVGGDRCPVEEVQTSKFLRILCHMFSYISAWNFLGKRRDEEFDLLLDSFVSKYTPAWYDLIGRIKPKVFQHGDECNPFISCADLFAFLTDAKLYSNKLRLEPDNVKEVWKDHDFEVETRFLDEKILSKYKWVRQDHIDIKDYIVHPVVFLLVDEIEKLGVSREITVPDSRGVYTEVELTAKPRKFHEVIRKMEPYYAAIKYAFQLGGSMQFYDRYIDSDKVRDGDVLIYIGQDSSRIAKTYLDIFDVEIMSAKELRNKMRKKL